MDSEKVLNSQRKIEQENAAEKKKAEAILLLKQDSKMKKAGYEISKDQSIH